MPTRDEMTSAVDRAADDQQRVQTREDEEGDEDAVGDGDGEGEGRRCGCGKTLLRKPSAPAAVSPSSKHSRRKRRKKPPYGGEQRGFSGGTADTTAPNLAAVPEIRVTGETDPEDERESSRELSSGTNSTGGAVDEGIYDGNSSSIESSLFGNKSSNSGSRKSSRDDTRSSREQRWSRRPSYLHTGDAISLMIIEGCELCQEKIRRQEREVKVAGSGFAVSTVVSNSSTSGRRRCKKKHDQSMVTRSQHDPENWMFCPTTISTHQSPTPSCSSSISSSRSRPPPSELPAPKPPTTSKRFPQPLPHPKYEPEHHGGALPKLYQRVIYEKSSEGIVDDPERFRSRYVRKKKTSSSSSSSGPVSVSHSSSHSPLTPPLRAARGDEGEFHPHPEQPETPARLSPNPSESPPDSAAASPNPLPQTRSTAPHNPNASSVLPTYIQNIIYHSQHAPPKPQHDAKLLKKLSKSILLPEDPADPTAFTVTPGLTRPPKAPWCSSKPVIKIVGTFAILMSLGIIIAIVYVNYFSDTFRPMHM